jgi:hypothetical protein
MKKKININFVITTSKLAQIFIYDGQVLVAVSINLIEVHQPVSLHYFADCFHLSEAGLVLVM